MWGSRVTWSTTTCSWWQGGRPGLLVVTGRPCQQQQELTTANLAIGAGDAEGPLVTGSQCCCCRCCRHCWRVMCADGTAQGVLFLNSNGMDIILNKTSVTFRQAAATAVWLPPSPTALNCERLSEC